MASSSTTTSSSSSSIEKKVEEEIFTLQNSIFVKAILKGTEEGKGILLAGCGGGYDIYSGIALYAALRKSGRDNVHLANLAFTYEFTGCESLVPDALWKVDSLPTSRCMDNYHPEAYLSAFLSATGRYGERVPVYTIERRGVAPIRAAYQWLVEHLNLGAIVLVDGGTDSLMKGDEQSLGTPEEDFASIAAVDSLEGGEELKKYLACIGWGVDTYHGVNHNLVLENIAEVVRTKPEAFYGAVSLLPTMPEFQLFKDACYYAWKRMEISIVSGSVLHSVEGQFGDYRFTPRTGSSSLFLNPLMGLLWAFDLDVIAQLNVYVRDPKFLQTERRTQVSNYIYSKATKKRPPTPFPH